MTLADVARYLHEMGVPDMSRAERGALPRILRAAVMEDELHRRRVDRLTVIAALSAIVNVGVGVWVTVHQ